MCLSSTSNRLVNSLDMFKSSLIVYMLSFYPKNGLISALPYAASCAVTVITSIVSDQMISRGIPRTRTRKILGSIGLNIPLIAVIALSFVTCKNQQLGVILLIIGISSNSITWSGGHMVKSTISFSRF